jgi:hypothetical protein
VFREKERVDLITKETVSRAGTQEVVLNACHPWQFFPIPGKQRPPVRSHN